MEWKIELGDDIEGFECFEIPTRTGNLVERWVGWDYVSRG